MSAGCSIRGPSLSRIASKGQLGHADLPEKLRAMMGLRGCTGAVVGLLLLHIAHGARKDTSGEAAASSHRVIFFIVGAHEALICMADLHREIK